MRRFVLFALICSVGNSSAAFAGETLLGSAARIVREVDREQPAPVVKSLVQHHPFVPSFAQRARVGQLPSGVFAQQGAGPLSASGVSKRTKVLIFVAAAVGFVGAAYKIDHSNEDPTPSSAGTRED